MILKNNHPCPSCRSTATVQQGNDVHCKMCHLNFHPPRPRTKSGSGQVAGRCISRMVAWNGAPV